jgi:hypothetical protein
VHAISVRVDEHPPFSPNGRTKRANKILIHFLDKSGIRQASAYNAARHHHQQQRRRSGRGSKHFPSSSFLGIHQRVCCGEAITREVHAPPSAYLGPRGVKNASGRESTRGAIIALSGVDARVNNDTLIKITMQQCWLAAG